MEGLALPSFSTVVALSSISPSGSRAGRRIRKYTVPSKLNRMGKNSYMGMRIR